MIQQKEGEIFGAGRVGTVKKCRRSLRGWCPCGGWEMDIHDATESVKCVTIKNENLDFINQLLGLSQFKCFLKQNKGKKSTEIKDQKQRSKLKIIAGNLSFRILFVYNPELFFLRNWTAIRTLDMRKIICSVIARYFRLVVVK